MGVAPFFEWMTPCMPDTSATARPLPTAILAHHSPCPSLFRPLRSLAGRIPLVAHVCGFRGHRFACGQFISHKSFSFFTELREYPFPGNYTAGHLC